MSNIDILTIIWGIISILFFALSLFHFWLSTKALPEFEITQVSGMGGDISVTRGGRSVSVFQAIDDVQNEIHTFVGSYNKATKNMNLIQGFGYLVAFVTALIALYLTVDC